MQSVESVKTGLGNASIILDMLPLWLLPSLVESLANGSILVVASIGLTLTLAVVKLPNFAHAEFLTVGAYIGVLVSSLYPNNLLLIGAAVFVVCSALAVAIHYVVYKPLMERKVSIYFLVLASFAVAQFVRYGVYFGASTSPRLLATQQQIRIFSVGSIFSTEITNVYALSIFLAIVISVLLALFLNLTHLGKSMRAVANNFDLARISGINVSRVVNIMWIIAGGLGGVGGMVLGTYTTVTPALGFNILLDIFAVVIIAGLTSFVGTIIGGLLVGFSQNTVADFLYFQFGVPLGYAPLLPFALIVVVLLFRPTGLAPNSQRGIDLFRSLLRRNPSSVKSSK